MPKKIAPILIATLVVIATISYVFYQNYLVAASVNGKPISRLAVIAKLEKQGGKSVLDTIITQQLISEQAKKDNISVSQDEVDKEIKKIEASVASQGGTLDEALAQKGMTKADLSDEIKLQVTIQKLVKANEIKITDKEVEKYITDNKEQFPTNTKEKPDINQIKESLRQEKLQTKIQEFVTNLRKNAKITYFGSYK